MEEIDSKEMTFEVMLSTVTKGLIEAFKEAGSQDTVSAIAGRLGIALPYVLVTAGKITAWHGAAASSVTQPPMRMRAV